MGNTRSKSKKADKMLNNGHSNEVVYPPIDENEERVLVRAIQSYTAQRDEEMSFNEGEHFYLLTEEPFWPMAMTMNGQFRGHVPRSYVVKDDGSPSSVNGWFAVGRREANRMLLRVGNPKGTFLIRPSSAPGNFALSVKTYDETTKRHSVTHYKINSSKTNGSFFVQRGTMFPSLHELIIYYSAHDSVGMTRLTHPCPREALPPPAFHEMEVDRSTIRLVQPLGHGAFGEVSLGVWSSAVKVAVKRLRMDRSEMDREEFLQEAKIMHKFCHPHVVQIMGVCSQPPNEPVWIICEYMAKGALLDYLRQDRRGKRILQFDHILDIIAQVVDGMAYLEKSGFVHRDLRAANILLGEDLVAKVSDFGLARITQGDGSYICPEDSLFPVKWGSPEVFTENRFTTKSDVWSFGILMYEVVTLGGVPYPDMNNQEAIQRIKKGYRMSKPDGVGIRCPDELYHLMLACWSFQAEDRPTFEYLRSVFENWDTSNEVQYPITAN